MRIFLLIIYYLACFLIVIWLVRPSLFWLIGLEFSDPEVLLKYRYEWMFVLPGLIGITIINKVLGKEISNTWATAIISRIGIGILAYFLVWMSLFTGMCSWREDGILFTNQSNGGKVVIMEYLCGAYDTDINPKREIRKIVPFGKYFQWNHSCDITELEMDKWVENNL